MFYVATKASDVASEYAVFTTDGVAERVYTDANGDSAYNATETAAVAWFKQFENTLYLSMDASCESGGSSVEPCLQKGDLIFIADANWGRPGHADRAEAPGPRISSAADCPVVRAGFADTADLYTITKIWTAQPTLTTGRRTVTASRSTRTSTGTARKSPTPISGTPRRPRATCRSSFTPATTGTFTYASQCSNRGLCNGDDALCECFKGYTNDNCDTQSSCCVKRKRADSRAARSRCFRTMTCARALPFPLPGFFLSGRAVGTHAQPRKVKVSLTAGQR